MVGKQVRTVGVVFDERPQQVDHRPGLSLRGGSEVDVVIVEAPEFGQGLGERGGHADPATLRSRLDHGGDEGAQLLAPSGAAPTAHQRGEHVRGDDAGGDGVFEVVADVGDAICP